VKFIIVRLLGLYWIVMGILGLVATKKSILALSNFIKNTKRQSMGMLALVFGILLLISADITEAPWFVLALGIMACLKGMTTILMTEKKFKEVIDWWLAGPDVVYKAWAIFALILGVAMFYIT